MIIFFSGTTFQQVINEVIEKTGQIMFPPEISNELDFLKEMRQNITRYENVDIMILDESVCRNTDEELLTALEMLRTMYNDMKIILFAPYRQEGDDFLTKCFQMGILNIVNTDDFLKIREELEYCIVIGKTYREAARYKESKKERVVVRHEIKRSVNKRMIGIAGVEGNIGVTHNAIVLANFFRKQGYMVALVEMNGGSAFEEIRGAFDEKTFQDGYFTLGGVDFYAGWDVAKLPGVMEHSYNVILLDFGVYRECDRTAFERCEDKLIISGSKPWELEAANEVFELASQDALFKYIFCFNFTPQSDYDAIKEGMGGNGGPGIENVHFLSYTVNPFTSFEFADAEDIFSDILPERQEEKREGFFAKLKGKGKRKEETEKAQ